MKSKVRVLVFAHAKQAEDAMNIEEAYHQISQHLQETRGLLGNELLHSVNNKNHYIVVSEWESLEAFKDWEEGTTHRQTTSPLRPYLTGATYYEVEAAYSADTVQIAHTPVAYHEQ